MQVTLFKALKSASVGDEAATAVVEHLALFVESAVNNNIRAIEGRIAGVEARIVGVEAKLAGVEVKIDAVEAKLDAKLDALNGKITFLMAIMALAVGLGPILAKLIHA